jgi:tripartite-type tricarboxylate transporter receptor subunit TctC
MRRIFAAALILLAGVHAAAADTYPSRTVKLLCWTSAGAPLDVMMRQLGKQLADIFKQTVVVENRAGGSGVAAMATLMNQPSDGYSILSTTSSMSFTMATGRIAFGPQNFTVLPAIQAEPSAVAVRADSRFTTLDQLIEHLRDHPDTLTVGGFSAAGFHQFVFYRLQQEGKFKADWIPFKGGQEAGLALLGGHIDVAVITPSSAPAQIQSGDIRLLGIIGAARCVFPGHTDLQGAGLERRRDDLARRHGEGGNAASGDRRPDRGDRQGEGDAGVEGLFPPEPALLPGRFAGRHAEAGRRRNPLRSRLPRERRISQEGMNGRPGALDAEPPERDQGAGARVKASQPIIAEPGAVPPHPARLK